MLNYRLTGVHTSDHSDASGTLTERAAAELGLPASVAVVAGAGDNAAAAVGTGTVGDGGCNLSLGTSGTLFISGRRFGADPMNALHAFAHADGGWHLMACMLSAASCSRWLCERILHTEDYEAEQAAIEDGALGRGHVFFLPYLMGERSPINDTDARGAFIGIPQVKPGIIAVSRDCFPIELATARREAIVAAYGDGSLYNCKITVENETDAVRAVREAQAEGCSALVVFLGNFGPETPETLIAQSFDGPVMYIAAAEGDGDLINGRGDAYSGLLNCAYDLGLRRQKAYIPPDPVVTAGEAADRIRDFLPVARALIGLWSLKIISFGPRPQDFFACNAPIGGLYELGVEIEENSELDLLAACRAHGNDARIAAVCRDMAAELGVSGNRYPELLPRMAQFELTLLDWAEEHKGARKYVAFANKCWPAFPEQFGFEPCYVNSRLASRGIPVACEVDIYGALSEYLGACVTQDAVTLLDINNSVPKAMFDAGIAGRFPYRRTDTFMGFHCGNTPGCKLCADRAVKYQLIQNRLLENGGTPDFTRGTLEADLASSEITLYRLQCDSEGVLRAYAAEGEILPVRTGSFGGIGVFAIPEMGRFYRHVLIEKRYPHHGAVAFSHCGGALYEVLRYLGVTDIAYNRPAALPYPTENPFV